MRGNKTRYLIWIKFWRVVEIPDVITCANFYKDRLRGLGLVGVKICPSPLTLIVAVTTLALPCECVIRSLGNVLCNSNLLCHVVAPGCNAHLIHLLILALYILFACLLGFFHLLLPFFFI